MAVGNTYTINHLSYVVTAYTMGCYLQLIQAAIAHLSNEPRTCPNFSRFFYFLFRLCILVIIPYVIYNNMVPWAYQTWHINNDNWWKSKDEPFFTNDSKWCAFFAWAAFLFSIPSTLIFAFMLGMGIVMVGGQTLCCNFISWKLGFMKIGYFVLNY